MSAPTEQKPGAPQEPTVSGPDAAMRKLLAERAAQIAHTQKAAAAERAQATTPPPTARHVEGQRRDAGRSKGRAGPKVGAKTAALVLIVGCFAASAAIRAGDYAAEKATATLSKPTQKPAPQPPARMASAAAIASGDFATGSTPDAAEHATTEGKGDGLAADTMAALGHDPHDPAAALGLEHVAQAGGGRAGPTGHASAPTPEVTELLDALRRREAELSAYSKRLDERKKELEVIEKRVEERIRQLEREKEVFAGLVATIEQASKKDVEHLVAMYSRMKPKKAAQIFNTMDPGFAAGFLVRMRADKASLILAAMDPTRAYAVSLRMAGRNVKAGDPPIDALSSPAEAPKQGD